MNRFKILGTLGILSVAVGGVSAGAPPAAVSAPAAGNGSAGACAGNWTVVISNPNGPTHQIPTTLAQNGEQLTGKLIDPNSGKEVAVKGTCKDGVMTFVGAGMKRHEGNQPIDLTFTGQVRGDNLSGTVKLGELGEIPFTGSRQ